MRGPAITPSLPGRPELPTRGERFDELVLETVRDDIPVLLVDEARRPG
jgi:hypothetical protein